VDIIRNTIVARATGKFTSGIFKFRNDGSQVANIVGTIIKDNAFVNVGPIPVLNTQNFAAVSNNITDNATSTSIAGFTTVAAGTLLKGPNDYRPVSNGPLAGMASGDAIDMPDIRYIARGGIPDIGAVQGDVIASLTQVTIT